jgi:hypothetical protein
MDEFFSKYVTGLNFFQLWVKGFSAYYNFIYLAK